jgi:hypothetical protein
VNEQISFY